MLWAYVSGRHLSGPQRRYPINWNKPKTTGSRHYSRLSRHLWLNWYTFAHDRPCLTSGTLTNGKKCSKSSKNCVPPSAKATWSLCAGIPTAPCIVFPIGHRAYGSRPPEQSTINIAMASALITRQSATLRTTQPWPTRHRLGPPCRSARASTCDDPSTAPRCWFSSGRRMANTNTAPRARRVTTKRGTRESPKPGHLTPSGSNSSLLLDSGASSPSGRG